MKLECCWEEPIGPILYVTIKNRKIGFCICHKKKDRSIKLFGLENYFCSRCLGILIGYFIGLIISNIYTQIPMYVAFLFIIPLIVDGFTQLIHLRESNNKLRLVTGIFFGFGLLMITKYAILIISGL
jgi:uncharacterized membrane protein